MTYRDIAEKLGVSKRQIENLKLKKHDVDYDRAVELRAGGMSIRDIAKQLRVGWQAVDALNLPDRPCKQLSAAEAKKAKALREAGKPIKSIAKELKVREEVVRNLFPKMKSTRNMLDSYERQASQSRASQRSSKFAKKLFEILTWTKRKMEKLGPRRDCEHLQSHQILRHPNHEASINEDKDSTPAGQHWHETKWMSEASWTFYPLCGRRRPNGKIQPDWNCKDRKCRAKVHCPGGCDRRAEDLCKPVTGDAKAIGRIAAYVTPQKEDWPEELFNLTAAEAASLEIIKLNCTYKNIRGGKSPVTSRKKTQVIKATWRRTDVEAGLPTAAARAAFSWLMEKKEQHIQGIHQEP